MSDGTPDLDDMIDAAWKDYRDGLAEALDALDDDGCIQIEFASEGVTPYVQALRTGDELLLEASSNRFLDQAWRLDKAGRKRLRAIGFAKPSEHAPNYWIVLPITHVDQAASIAVRALRDGFGILHPSFLVGDGVGWEPGPAPDVGPVETAQQVAATFPRNRQHLDELVERALSHVLDEVPDRDGDGDIPLRTGRTVVFVRTHEGSPLIRLFALIATDVTHPDAALLEVDHLNRTVDGVKFVLQRSCVVAVGELLAWPFAPTQFQSLLMHLCDEVAKHESDVVDRVGGRHFVQPTAGGDGDGVDSIHPAMLSILQLDAERPGSLRPKDAARICGNDPDLLLELIRWNEEQEIEWRQARDETDDPEEEQVCEAERRHARRTVKLLRKALRRVLLG